MKIKKQDEYNEICAALEKKSEEIELLGESYGDLLERRSDLFSEIILENKLLRGDWKLWINAVPTVILSADKLKKKDDLGKLVDIGYSLREERHMYIKTDAGTSITMTGNGAFLKLEVCLLYVDNLDKLFEFFKEQGIKLKYNIFDFRMRAMKKQIAFLERLEE